MITITSARIAPCNVFVLHEHAVSADLCRGVSAGSPSAFSALLASLAYIALTRVVAQGRQLAAMDQEMRSAREIQTSILPRGLPSIRGL